MTVPAQIEPQWGDDQTKPKGFNPILLTPSLLASERKSAAMKNKLHVRTKTKRRVGLSAVNTTKSFRFENPVNFISSILLKRNKKSSRKTSSLQRISLIRHKSSFKKGSLSKKSPVFQNLSSGFAQTTSMATKKNVKKGDLKITRLIKTLPVDRILRPEIISFIIAFFIFSILCGLDIPHRIVNREGSLQRMISLVSENELDHYSAEEGSVSPTQLYETSHPKMAAFALDLSGEESTEENHCNETLKIKTYRVREGDALSLIAAIYGVRCESIASFNKINDIRKIKPGEEIGIPSEDGLLYRIERNDNHSNIANKLNLDGASREKFLIDYPKLLPTGRKIFIRGAQMSSHQKNKLTGGYFLYPLNGTLLTGFGITENKRTGVEAFSEGIELAAAKGSVASASRSGTVIYSRQHPALGGCVMIEHKDGMVSVYGQLMERSVVVGEEVEQGESLGLIGNPVFGKGPHLFFSIKKNGNPVDPLEYLY